MEGNDYLQEKYIQRSTENQATNRTGKSGIYSKEYKTFELVFEG
jgi:hypothetical protein